MAEAELPWRDLLPGYLGKEDPMTERKVMATGSATAADNGTGMAGNVASVHTAPNDSTGVTWTQE